MAQVGFEKGLTTEWVRLADEYTFTAGKTYYIQNRGADYLLTLEPDSAPSENDDGGDMWKPYERLTYEVGTNDLYVRAFNSNCSINITVKDD